MSVCARLVVVAALAVGVAATPALAASPTIRTFTPAAAPAGLAAGPDGSMWATSSANNSVVRVAPNGASQEFTDGNSLNGSPLGIAAGPDRKLWFVENAANRIVSITTRGSGAVGFNIPTPSSGPGSIAAGPDGNLWFTEFSASKIGRITTNGAITEFPAEGTGPIDIAAGADGAMWFTSSGSNSIGRIRSDGSVTTFGFFRDGAAPSAITAGADGNLWFSESGFPAIGQIDPVTGSATDFPISSPASAVTAGPDGNVWFVTANRTVGRITPAGAVTEFPTGLPIGESFLDLRTGADGHLWASTSDGKLLRISTGAPPPRFTDSAQIALPATGDKGVADPYPATIEAEGLQGTVTKVTVRLNGVHHGFASDIQALLVGPQGQSSVLMANPTDRIGDLGVLAQPDVFDGDVLTFADGGATPLRRPTNGIFAPFDPGFLLAFTPPAPPNVPAPPASLSVFNGTNPNGTWKLFLVDDDDHSELSRPTTGVIAAGWSLDIQTSGPPPVQLPAPDPIVVQGPTQTVQGQAVTPPAPAPAAADTTAPTLTLGKLPTRLKLRDFRKGVRVTVTPSEPVTVDATLAVTPRILFERTTKLAGPQTLTLKPSATSLGKPPATFKVRLRLVVTDNAANRTTVQKTITVTR